MQQAIESFFIGDGDGNEIFVPKGKVFADNHPIAINAPKHFEPLELDEPSPKPKPQQRQHHRS
jgi:hypothetical protein